MFKYMNWGCRGKGIR